MKINEISKTVLERIPLYVHYLKAMPGGAEYVSATAIARATGFGEVLVRKDLSSVSGAGKPKVGYKTSELILRLESFLGYNRETKAVIVGAGKLGRALLGYVGFKEYGLEIVAAFDKTAESAELMSDGKSVYPMSELNNFCRKNDIKIGIITVPATEAQTVCDALVSSGILAVWNFAPIGIKASEDILIRNENMASSLALLSAHLEEKLK